MQIKFECVTETTAAMGKSATSVISVLILSFTTDTLVLSSEKCSLFHYVCKIRDGVCMMHVVSEHSSQCIWFVQVYSY